MFLFVLAARADTWDPGATIEPAAVADITPEGFASLGALIPALLPPSISIDPMSADDGYYAYSFSNGQIGIGIDSTDISPGNGVVDVNASLEVSVNDASNPFYLYYSALWGLIEGDCPGYVDPFQVDVHTTLALEVVDPGDGTRVLDATLGEIEVSYALDGENIHLDCGIQDVEDVLSYFGLSIYDLIIDQLDSYLQDTIADMGPTLEETIEDAFAQASISQELDLNGAVATLELEPSDVQITPDGARVLLAGSMEAPPSDCVSEWDPGGSLKTASEPPDIGSAPSSVPAGFHAALALSDDFANEALYALWRGGLLCYVVDEETSPIPITTSLLDGMADGEIEAVIPESTAVTIVTRPQVAPTVAYDGSHNLDINIDTLGLDFYTEVDGRQARLLGLDLNGTAGADLAFDGSTGEMGIAVYAESGSLTATASYNELAPAASAGLEENFGTLFDSIVGMVLGSYLEEAVFGLPTFSGLGLSSMQIEGTGDNLDWLGVYAGLGVVSYTGDSSCGGCGGSETGAVDTASSGDCGGCASLPTAPLGFVGFATALVLRRRR